MIGQTHHTSDLPTLLREDGAAPVQRATVTVGMQPHQRLTTPRSSPAVQVPLVSRRDVTSIATGEAPAPSPAVRAQRTSPSSVATPALRFAEPPAPAPTPVQTFAPTTFTGPAVSAALPAPVTAPTVSVQREMTDPEPPAAPDSLTEAGLPEVNVDDLAARLYPALAERLKAELRHDRDRAGRLTGL